MKIILSLILGSILGFVAGNNYATKTANKYLEAYGNYYKASETLLDSLDSKYSWTDAFDPQDYYIYNEKLDSLM